MTKSKHKYSFPRVNCPLCRKKVAMMGNKLRKHYSIKRGRTYGFVCAFAYFAESKSDGVIK